MTANAKFYQNESEWSAFGNRRREHSGMEYREYLRNKRALRRRYEVRIHFSLLILGILLVICLSVCCHVINSHAETSSENAVKKYYTSILIESGDTLWSLAQEYADDHYTDLQSYMDEVIFINHLDTADITEGYYLIVPYYAADF